MALLQIILLILLADFITGIVHWWEDAYGDPNWEFLGIGKYIVIPNLEHHKKPRGFLKSTVFERNKIQFLVAGIVFLICLTLGFANWQLCFFLLYSCFSNEFHAMAHRTDQENGQLVVFLQKIGLVQSRLMHGLHHTSPYDINYCVMTNYLNPVLNWLTFWSKLEGIISLFGIKPKRNSEVRNFK